MKPKRCKKCNKIIRQENNSGYCASHASHASKVEKLRKMCGICQEPCSGKLLIEHYKGRIISLCTYHFNTLNIIDDPKELRQKIKYLKSYH